MSDRSSEPGAGTTAVETGAAPERPGQSVPAPAQPRRGGPNRRTWTLVISFVVVVALGLIGGFVRVPYVALGPGPTYDTLGQVGGTDVVHVDGQSTFPTKGHLTMTTVSLTDNVTLFGALGLWLSGRYALAPREEFFRPGQSEQEVQNQNVKAFQDSQTNAEAAALRYLGYPTKVLASEITSGSPADNTIGPGDRMLVVNGKQVTSAVDVRAALTSTKPGDRVEITFQHGTDAPKTAQVALGRADGRESGFLGVLPVDRADVPFDVKISLSEVGGPSAGLMFALSIVDKLTPGELNGGQSIAGTGEIDEAGDVGPIGGIAFKMVAAREGGATTFLVPEANCTEAKAQTPDGLRLVKVSKLADAVQSLDALRSGKDAPGC